MGEGKGHPLPASGEARHNEIPEKLEAAKGRGDDAAEVATPDPEAVAPDGEPYRRDDLGEDQRAHQDRGQSIAEEEEEQSGGRR